MNLLSSLKVLDRPLYHVIKVTCFFRVILLWRLDFSFIAFSFIKQKLKKDFRCYVLSDIQNKQALRFCYATFQHGALSVFRTPVRTFFFSPNNITQNLSLIFGLFLCISVHCHFIQKYRNFFWHQHFAVLTNIGFKFLWNDAKSKRM